MKYHMLFIATLTAVTAGVGVTYAAQPGDFDNSEHHSYVEWKYFSDSGFSAPADAYAKQGTETRQVLAEVKAEDANVPWEKHSITKPEFLYFTDAGFSSTPEGQTYLPEFQ